MKNQEFLDCLRHSCSHLLAAAVMKLYPKAKRTIGPAIENGFYFDFDFGGINISEADFPKIEEKMREIVKSWKGFERNELTKDQAKKEYPGNQYKQELIEEFSNGGEKLTFYKSGDYWDLCKGGHVSKPDEELKHFKLLSVAGAYWRGSEKNKMLTRIYGTCFGKKTELDNYLQLLEEIKKRDHRKLGKNLDLFSINPLTGQGLILWHPKLSIVRNIAEQFWRDIHYKNGYQLVFTPHIASLEMFVTSRHIPKYIDYMFPVMLHQNIEGESASDYQVDEVLKPMNCPNHIQIYKSRPRSYRELPMRIGELGTVYRYERAGVLHGMMRVRGFTQDDSHIFCTQEQAISEIQNVLKLMKEVYGIFGFNSYSAYISTRPEKYLGDLKMWQFAEDSLKEAAKKEGLDLEIDKGAGVFYGPKIDLKVKDSLGRQWQLGTVQFDFNQPDRAQTSKQEVEEFWKLKTFQQKFKTKENLAKYLNKIGRGFDVKYTDSSGQEKSAVMIHRVIFGSLERFFGILIEHYNGAFPLWLAPVQVVIIPISQKHEEYAKTVHKKFISNGIRCEIDSRSETMQAKLREAALQKIPFTGIIGDRETKSKTGLSVRELGKGDLGVKNIDDFISEIKAAVSSKR